MHYISTRGQAQPVKSAQAIKKGLAPDGGLYVPESLAKVPGGRLQQLAGCDYRQLAQEILAAYLTDYSEDEIKTCVMNAYSSEKFDHPSIAPVHSINNQLHVLELWHGPTCAFKDMALQILPHFMSLAAKKTGEEGEIVILVATSGDTGKAALEGFKDVEGTRVIVFFPEDGVSQVQKLQMLTQEGRNVNVVAVQGNFDDAQGGVKQVFSDNEFNRRAAEKNFRLSSANSINWGRLVPQIIYYFAAYNQLVSRDVISLGDKINFVVPTGNFGNILAGFYAREMGLPVNKLICASNSNNVLTEFIRTGEYDRNRNLLKTISPSMDILISSNLERLLFELTGRSDEKVRGWMNQLNEDGWYKIDPQTMERVQHYFWSDYADDNQTLETIKDVWDKHHYLIDTHTAVAFKVYESYLRQTRDSTKTVIASTASPFKFNASVARAVLDRDNVQGKSEFELLGILAGYTGWPIPEGLRNLDKKKVLHHKKTSAGGIGRSVSEILGI
ncbi:MAG: threonine synthase [Desulfotomaculum sp.]|nr:threonine synthase [Desulfotomaculum sp.]